MEKYLNKKKNKVVLEIDDEGNEIIDKEYFEDIAKKKKIEEMSDEELAEEFHRRQKESDDA